MQRGGDRAVALRPLGRAEREGGGGREEHPPQVGGCAHVRPDLTARGGLEQPCAAGGTSTTSRAVYCTRKSVWQWAREGAFSCTGVTPDCALPRRSRRASSLVTRPGREGSWRGVPAIEPEHHMIKANLVVSHNSPTPDKRRSKGAGAAVISDMTRRMAVEAASRGQMGAPSSPAGVASLLAALAARCGCVIGADRGVV